MDQDRIAKRIRAKLATGEIQLIYDAESRLACGGRICRGCDEPISERDIVSLGYRVRESEHWFHVMCDAIRARESAKLTKGGFWERNPPRE